MDKGDDKPYCFMDFDGTLVSNEMRLYRFLTENLPPKYKHILTSEEFWNLKKMKLHEIDWLNSTFGLDINKNEWNKKKKKVIETEEYLSKDQKFDFTDSVLGELREKYYIILVSRRESRDGLLGELKRMNLVKHFDAVEILPHGKEKKADRISNKYDYHRKGSILVGDTEDDMEAGISLSIPTYLVLSGIRGRWVANIDERFRTVNIIEDIRDLLG